MINIYKLLDPETLEIKYVGKTKESLIRRLNKHIFNKTKNSNVNKWIKSLIKDDKKPKIMLIERCSFEEWEQKEIYWIKFYRNINKNLLNMTNGGECGSLGYIHTQDAKNRISLLNSRPKSKEWIKNAADAMTKVRATKIMQYTMNDEFIREWESFCYAGKEINPLNYKSAIKNIHACCKLKRKSAYGFIWKYKI